MKRNNFNYFKKEGFYKRVITLTVFLFTINVNAQNPQKSFPTEVSVSTDSNIGKIDLQFKNDREVGNLLVTITDHSGQTIFIENISGFKGLYKKTIDLKANGKGSYNLKIIKDDEKIDKIINIR